MAPHIPADLQRVIDYCEQVLALDAVEESPTAYHSLPLCVIDAVYSIGARYESTLRVVRRYCDAFDLPYTYERAQGLPARDRQEAIPSFLARRELHGLEHFAGAIFANRQRTSTRSGILKADAVFRFAEVLDAHAIYYLQDVEQARDNPAVEADIRQIPGQRSGVSFKYFLMLAGSDEFIKPDRMIFRFLEEALGRSVTMQEAEALLRQAAHLLRERYAPLTPRLLDNAIWYRQRGE